MSRGRNASALKFVYQNLAMTLGVIRILGVDPGLRATGWGVIEAAGSRLSFVGCGSIETDAAVSLAERLAAIHRLLTGLVEREGPHEAAIEETFINRDPQSALKLGQARGVALATLALTGLPVAEYAANLIKKTVVGVGHAEKRQVAMMVRMLLPASTASTPDAADALAVAICHAQHRATRTRASCEKVEAGFSRKSERNRRNRQSAAIRLNRSGL
jgi:crossover junction endodeoxyribonuclease RuvC